MLLLPGGQANGKAGILPGVRSLQKGQQPPGGHHRGAAVGDKRKGDAGKGEQIDRAKDIETSLKDQQGGGGAGGDGVKAGAPGAAGTDGKNGQCDNTGRERTPMISPTLHTASQTPSRCRPRQPGGASPHRRPRNQSAGCGGRHGAGLLVAPGGGVLRRGPRWRSVLGYRA